MMARARTLIIVALLCCVSGSLAQQSSNKQNTGAISGLITIGGTPAPGVVVSLMQLDMNGLVQVRMGNLDQKALAKTTTDGEGKFTFNSLPAGIYTLALTSPTLIMVADSSDRRGENQIHLAEGETIEDIKMPLIRGGVITGRIIDSQGRPLIAERINLHQVLEGRQTRPFYLSNYSMAETDDRGIYRLYGVPPGRYRVSAGLSDKVPMGPASSYYEQTFYPDETDESKAKIIDVTSGSEATAIDIKLGKTSKTFYAGGRVVYADTGQPAEGVMCGYGVLQTTGKQLGNSSFISKTDKSGIFRLSSLRPGKYVAFSMAESNSDYYSEVVPFKIASENIDGIEIRLHRGSSLSGVVIIEGTDDPEILAKVSQVQIGVSAWDDLRAPTSSSSRRVGPDGSFRINGIQPGKVRLSAYIFPPQNFTMIRIEREGMADTEAIEIPEGAAISDVRIVMGYANGRVRGQVKIESGVIPEGSRFMIMVKPTDAKGVSSRGQPFIEVDKRGRFAARGIVPGEYQIELLLQSRSSAYQVASQIVTVAGNTDTEVFFVVDPKTIEKERDR